MSGSANPPPPPGRFDRVALAALAVTLLSQGAIGTWAASGAFSRISDNTRRIAVLEARADQESADRDRQNLAVLAALSDLRERTARIEASVSVLSEQRNRR
jgi:hypothetical protein